MRIPIATLMFFAISIAAVDCLPRDKQNHDSKIHLPVISDSNPISNRQVRPCDWEPCRADLLKCMRNKDPLKNQDWWVQGYFLRRAKVLT